MANGNLNKQGEEALELLSKRLKANNIDFNIIIDKTVLDYGCGSGRYCYALKKIGARKVIGFDIINREKIKIDNVEYKKGNIIRLPFKNESFDFVFCNGILSHTKKWKIGLKESYRVLRRKGWFWLSLFGKGEIWKYADNLSKKLNEKDADNLRQYLLYRDWDHGKINFLIDSFFSRDRIYFSRKQIKSELLKVGFSNIKFLERGVETDLNEKIFNNPELKKIFGEGEIRILAQKL